jgi:hypothetical protein
MPYQDQQGVRGKVKSPRQRNLGGCKTEGATSPFALADR